MKKKILFLFIIFFTISCSHTPKQKSNFEIGNDLLKKKNILAAVQYLEKATVEEPENYLAYNYLGYTYFQTGKFYKALECFEKSITINPEGSFAWKWKGEVLSRLGMEKEAQDYFRKSVELEKIENHSKEKGKRTK